VSNRTFFLLLSRYLFKLIWWCDYSGGGGKRPNNTTYLYYRRHSLLNIYIYFYWLLRWIDRKKEEEEEEKKTKRIVSFVCLYSYQLCTVYCSHCYKMKSSTDELNEVSKQTEFQHITTLHIWLARNPFAALLVDGAYALPSPYIYTYINRSLQSTYQYKQRSHFIR
jgi:hypothetical protein